MSNMICFISKNNKDISKLEFPDFIGGKEECLHPKYQPERKCIFTCIKTDSFYGDSFYRIIPDKDWVKQITDWAEENNLIITTDYDLRDTYAKQKNKF